jgi:hypothetical protein
MTMAKEIREFVTKNMNDVGTFTTRDVSDLSDNTWPSSNISVALNDWARCNWIVGGYRITKSGKRGGTQKWELIDASRVKPSEVVAALEDHEVFAGEVVDSREDGSFLVRTSKGVFYKVQRLEW